jgi:hypothetical protein
MKWSHTPMVYGLVPAVLYHGQLAGILVDPREAPNSKKAGDLPVTIRLDGFLLDHEGFLDEDTNLGNWRTQLVQGVVQTTTSNHNAELTAFFNGVGNALFNDGSARTCDITGTDCYYARTVPSITSINLSTGYTTGGQELIITGYSFDGDNLPQVTVGDATCDVKEYSATQIKCETGSTSLPSDPYSAGSNGLYHARFNGTAGANADTW